MILDVLFLLLPLAAASGWYTAKRSLQNNSREAESNFTRRYLVGLNYLLNEQPDKAVDIFIKMLEVDSEIVETHLALGTLFRRRGEVGRAIRIHQNLIARPNLANECRLQALLALGEDYLKAGVLDRAERVLLEFSEAATGELAIVGLRQLLEIYQQEKRWQAAIVSAEKLLSLGENVQKIIAHYYCELAEQHALQAQPEAALRYLKRALEVDLACVRASLLKSKLDMRAGHYQHALPVLERTALQNPDYLLEMIPAIVECYVQLNERSKLIAYLQLCLEQHPRISVVLALAKSWQEIEEPTAIHFLTEQLQQRPSVRGLQYLIELQLNNATGLAKNNLTILQNLMTDLVKNKPIYRCSDCGFNSKLLLWLCPGCHTWDSIKPIQGPEGD